MIKKQQIILGSIALTFSLIASANEDIFETKVLMGSFEQSVQVIPPGQQAPQDPRQGQLLAANTEVRTLEQAKADIHYNCEISLSGGQGYVLGTADECITKTANVQEAGLVGSPTKGQLPGQCEQPIAHIVGYDPNRILINGAPPSSDVGRVNLCTNDSVVASSGSQVRVVYPCTVKMGENSRLNIGGGEECVRATTLALTETGSVGQAIGAPAATAGGLGGAAAVAGAFATSVGIAVFSDDDDDNGGDGSPASPSQP